MDFYIKELENSKPDSIANDRKIDEVVEFYKDNELSSRPSQSAPLSTDSKALNLLVDEFSLDNSKDALHNSTMRKEFVSKILPAFNSQQEAHARLNEAKSKQYSKALISRASHVPLEKSMIRNILKNPFNEPQSCQQVSVQASIAKQFIDDEVPVDSAHHRKFSSTKKQLYDKFVAFQKNRLPLATPLNATYFYQLLNEMNLTKVRTIQQCSYCFDLKRINDITPERLAKCFLHDHFRRYQLAAYLLDKKQLNEGTF